MMRYKNENAPLPALPKKSPKKTVVPYSKTDFTHAYYGVAFKTDYPRGWGEPYDIYFTSTPNTEGSSVNPRFSFNYNNGVITDEGQGFRDLNLFLLSTQYIDGVQYYYHYFSAPCYQRINPSGYQGTVGTNYYENNVLFFLVPQN